MLPTFALMALLLLFIATVGLIDGSASACCQATNSNLWLGLVLAAGNRVVLVWIIRIGVVVGFRACN